MSAPLHPLPAQPSPFVQAWIDAALAWASPAVGRRIVDFYDRVVPEAWTQRFHHAAEPNHTLVRLDLRTAATPRLRRALDRLLTGARRAAIPPAATWGAADLPDLLDLHPRPVDLHRSAFFGCSQPLVSFGEPEQRALTLQAAAGWSPSELLDLRLAAKLTHELCHGPARPWSGGPGSWMVQEAAAAYVGYRCDPAHIVAERPGEAVLGLGPAMLLAHALLDDLGPDPLWRLALTSSTPTDVIGRRAGHALVAASWQRWATRQLPSFLPKHDHLATLARLYDLARDPTFSAPWLDRLDDAAQITPDLALDLPDLLQLAAAKPYPELHAWRERDLPLDRDRLHEAVRPLFQVERLQPDPQLCPSDPPGGLVHLDVLACLLSAEPRADDTQGFAAQGRLPPSWCRQLHDRGLRHLTFTDVQHERRAALTDRLLDLLDQARPLPATLELSLRPVARATPTLHLPPPPLAAQLHLPDPVITLGGCLARDLGDRLHQGGFELHRHPFGVTYDPLSIAEQLRWLTHDDPLPSELWFERAGLWHSRLHHLDLSSPDRNHAQHRAQQLLHAARLALRDRATLLITWDRALLDLDPHTGAPLAQRHDRPHPAEHTRLLSPDEVLTATLAALQPALQLRPDLRVLLTISPIRRPELGLVRDRQSKAVLHLAATTLAESHPNVDYLPAYEIVHDELRDHRWFTDDLVHLTPEALDEVFDRLLPGLCGPSTREHVRLLRAIHRDLVRLPRDPERRDAALRHLHDRLLSARTSPVLPIPGPLHAALAPPDAEPPSEPTPVAPPPARPSHLPALLTALQPGAYIGFDQQPAWTAAVEAALLPLLREARPDELRDARQALTDKAEELEAPEEVMPGLWAVVEGR